MFLVYDGNPWKANYGETMRNSYGQKPSVQHGCEAHTLQRYAYIYIRAVELTH